MLTNLLNRIPPIDLFSFIIGLILGLLFYVVGIRIYRDFRLMSVTRKKTDHNKYVTSSTKIISQYKTLQLKRAQSEHLLGALFPLSEVYTKIPLIYPYGYWDPSYPLSESIEATTLLPFLPGFPEFYETIPFRSVDLISILQDQNLILIQGELGSGKTTLLNSTISRIIENKSNIPEVDELLPVFIHYSEIDLNDTNNDEPHLDILDCGVFTKINCARATLAKTILPFFENGRVCIFVDGLDESNPKNIEKCSHWLRNVKSKFPLIKIVVSLNNSYIGNFLKDGFVLYHMCPMTQGIRNELVYKLSLKLEDFALLKYSSPDVFPDKIHYWHRQNFEIYDVFSLTLSCLSEFSLSGSGLSKLSLVNNYILRHCQHRKQMAVLSRLALKMSASPNHTLQKDAMASVFSDLQADTDNNSGNNRSLLETLIDLGFLLERQPGSFGFRFPQVYSYLLGIESNYRPGVSWENCFYDRSENFALASSKEKDYLSTWLNIVDEPLYRHFDILGLHLEKIKNDQTLLNKAIAQFINLLQQEGLPLPVKLKTLSLTLRLGSDSALKILDVLPIRFPKCKIFSILGYGFFSSDTSVSKIATLLSSSTSLEKALCAISLQRIESQKSRNELDKLLLSGDDLIRRIICESFSTDRINGHSKLKELSTNESLAIRKSSIYGIKIIDEDWVSDFLTSISIKDSEWLVRDSAAAALDELGHKIINISQFSFAEFEKNNWLVESASKRNLIIPPKIVPTDLLIDIVNTGSLQEKYASLFILSRFPNLKIKKLFNTLLQNNLECGDQVYFYLNELSGQDMVEL
ncbi:MAG: hypothetical protein MUF15_26105 [Acidobacteria bacterium]|jgi:energy-coupling factor transporter ATP-binding protein EcfA2|nr:hypothetical protein [Acidobacteriota bacterium]